MLLGSDVSAIKLGLSLVRVVPNASLVVRQVSLFGRMGILALRRLVWQECPTGVFCLTKRQSSCGVLAGLQRKQTQRR